MDSQYLFGSTISDDDAEAATCKEKKEEEFRDRVFFFELVFVVSNEPSVDANSFSSTPEHEREQAKSPQSREEELAVLKGVSSGGVLGIKLSTTTFAGRSFFFSCLLLLLLGRRRIGLPSLLPSALCLSRRMRP